MEGSRSSKYKRGLGRAAWRRAHAVADTSPRRRTARRRRDESPPDQGVFRRKYGNPQEQVWDAPFEFLGTVRNRRRRREPTPEPPDKAQRPQTPDPDDDPDPVLVAAAIPVRSSLSRRERYNYDLEWSGPVTGWQATWKVPLATIVGIARGSAYDERATSFIRLERIAFKVTAYKWSDGYPQGFIVPPNPDPLTRYNTCYFRVAIIYDKQSDGTAPTTVAPSVFSTSAGFAINQFRDSVYTERYEVLFDRTYRWRDGVLTYGLVEYAAVGTPFWMQQGMLGREEEYIDLDKLVHFTTDAGTTASISSGNVFYMMSQIGIDDLNVVLTSRTTYSDNLKL